MVATLVSIEGNIGAGKSTLLRALADVGARQVAVVPEPVDMWCSPVLPGGTSMLQAYYGDKQRNALAFQMFAMLTRAQQLREVCGRCTSGVVVTERCSWSDYELFGRPMHNTGLLNDAEWHTYSAWFQAITATSPTTHNKEEEHGMLGLQKPAGVVYLASNPDVCAARIASRARDGEDDIEHAYLELLHDAHVSYIDAQIAAGTPVHVVDATKLGLDKQSQHRAARDVLTWAATLTA